jgi:hypothetical protein
MTARVLGTVGGLPLIVKHLDVIKHVDHSATATPRGPSKAMWQLLCGEGEPMTPSDTCRARRLPS